MASTVTKSHGTLARILLTQTLKSPIKPSLNPSRKISSLLNSQFQLQPNSPPSRSSPPFFANRFCTFNNWESIQDPIQELLAEVELEKQREKEEKKRAGITVGDEEDEEDFMGVGPLIEKLEKRKVEEFDAFGDDEPTDSESESDDGEMYTEQTEDMDEEVFENKFKLFEELLNNFAEADNLDDAHKWMNRIDKFEQKHFRLPLEYRVIGELMNRVKTATGKERFMLLQKLNRAVRLVEWKEKYDPNNPANYGVIQLEQGASDDIVANSDDIVENSGYEREKHFLQGVADDDDDDDDDDEEEEEDFDDLRDKDDIYMEKLNAIDQKLEEKVALLDHTFGKKGKVLVEEINELAEERYALTEKKRRPLYRKGFDVRTIDVNRTCKVTKGGQVIKYSALLVCGNYHGVIGFAKAKAPAVPIALQKAYEKCFQNLHYVERFEEHTIAHAIQTNYKKTKIYLWPASTRTGMKASKTVETILNLAGYKNVKSKIIGSRNPYNTVKAVFKALNAVESPKDVQQKFGRTVVESYLL